MSSFLQNLSWLPRAPQDFRQQCRQIVADPAEASSLINRLAATALDVNQLLRLAKSIRDYRQQGHADSDKPPLQLLCLTNGTPDLLLGALEGTAPRYGISLECVAPAYDQAVQAVLHPDSPVYRFRPNAVLLALDWRALPLAACLQDPSSDVVSRVLGHFQLLLEGILANTTATCIVQNVPAPAERILGSYDRSLLGTPRNILDQVNVALGEAVRQTAGVLLDVAGLAELVGLANWHSPSNWNLAKLQFSESFIPLYADYVCRTIAAMQGKSRRCLVLDLDNTLWGGVIGDDGLGAIQIAQGDAIGEAFLDFQRYVLSLRDAGIVLAVCSKNDEQTARLPFRHHPEMLLREDHFAVFKANWRDKPSNLRAISQELSLGLESFVFVDDNPFERELVRKTLPQVFVPEMPDDPALFSFALSSAGYFEAISFSSEDAKRAGFYQSNSQRAALQSQATDLETYLESLQMEIWFQPFNETGRKRITQLINKSNQFNLTTRRYSEAEVAAMEASSDVFTLQVRLKDVFGDNGMISVVICRTTSSAEWLIDTWLMSCRVLGRRVENAVLREILLRASEKGIRYLRGFYLPTERNGLVQQHYASLGFSQAGADADGSTEWLLEVGGAQVLPAPMVVHSEAFVMQ
jgi:FkbH-like protein